MSIFDNFRISIVSVLKEFRILSVFTIKKRCIRYVSSQKKFLMILIKPMLSVAGNVYFESIYGYDSSDRNGNDR